MSNAYRNLSIEELQAEYDRLFSEDAVDLSDVPEVTGEVLERRPWTITDEGMAEWAASRIDIAHRKYQRALQRRERYMARLNEDVERAQKDVTAAEEFFGGRLADWLSEQLADGKRKSRVFLCGLKAGFRKLQPKADVYDKANALPWLKENHPELVRTKVVEEVEQKALNEYAFGHREEQIPGVQRIEARDKFYLEAGMDE